MIFSVQNNSMAMATMRNLQKAGFSMNKSMEKLSSGFRINTAADSPADLVMSEQLRARIEGLEKAIRNVRTTGNVMDIADGALGEVQGILRNMQKLAIHSMNSGITTGEQVAADQAELDAGLQAIDRIIGTTTYAGRKLLDGLNLGGRYGVGGTLVVNGNNADATADGSSKSPSLPDRSGAANGGLVLDRNPVPANKDPMVDAEGKLLADKTFTIAGRDGDPESMETVNFAAGTSLDDILAKLREYTIAPEQAAGLDPEFAPPGVRLGENIDQVDLDLNALSHIQNMGDDAAKAFLADHMKNFTPKMDLVLVDGKEIDWSKLSKGEKALYELSQNLMDMSMGGLGTTQVVIGKDENGNDITKTYSLQDLYAGGTASLRNNADATLAVLKKAGKDISGMRAEIAAKRKYAVEADENLLYSELESYTRAESYLRDTDFATEMTTFTRSKIVSQVGTQMLSAVFDHSKSILDLFA